MLVAMHDVVVEQSLQSGDISMSKKLKCSNVKHLCIFALHAAI